MVSVNFCILVKLFDFDSRMDVWTSVAASWSYIDWVISDAIHVSAAEERWNDTADRSHTNVGATLERNSLSNAPAGRPWNVTLITPRPSLFVAKADSADDKSQE